MTLLEQAVAEVYDAVMESLLKWNLAVTDDDLREYLIEYGPVLEIDEFMDVFYDWLADVI